MKGVPLPGSLSTEAQPPCCSATTLTIERPSPVPAEVWLWVSVVADAAERALRGVHARDSAIHLPSSNDAHLFTLKNLGIGPLCGT